MSRPARGRRRDRGAAAVEFAIVLPVFLTIVLGGIDFGYYFFASEVVTNAAREGARVGSVQDPVTGDPVTRAENAATTYLQASGLKSTGAVVKAYLVQSTAMPSCGPTPTGVGAGDSVWVDIKYPLGPITGSLAWIKAFDFNPHSCAVMRWK
jgi:Flp pilus assembly protein TadG